MQKALLAELSAQRSIAPRVLARNIRNIARHFRPGRQEDAHEYFICVRRSAHRRGRRLMAVLALSDPADVFDATGVSLVGVLGEGRLQWSLADPTTYTPVEVEPPQGQQPAGKGGAPAAAA